MSSPRPKRIVIFGPESTGKTTLARSLAEHFHGSCSPEYVRLFWDAHHGKIEASDLEAIGLGQVAVEDVAERSAIRVAFCDTDLLTCTIWNDLLFPESCPQWERDEAEVRAQRTTLYLLCLTDVPYAPDPQRCFPDEEGRAMCMRLWKQKLIERSLPFVEIGGPFSGRLEKAIAAVEQCLRS